MSTLAKLAGVETTVFKEAIGHLFRRLGEVLKDNDRVLIDFSVGSLVSDKGTVQFVFHHQAEQAMQEQEESKQQESAVSSTYARRKARWKRPVGQNTVTQLRETFPLKPAMLPAGVSSTLRNAAGLTPAPPARPMEGNLPNSSAARFRRTLQVLTFAFVKRRVRVSLTGTLPFVRALPRSRECAPRLRREPLRLSRVQTSQERGRTAAAVGPTRTGLAREGPRMAICRRCMACGGNCGQAQRCLPC